MVNVCYVIGTYPSFSTTFIDREIRMMRHWGMGVQLLSVRQPDLPRALSQEQRSNQKEVVYLIPVDRVAFVWSHLYFLFTRLWTYLSTLVYLLTRPHPSRRDWWMTVLHFGEGVYAAYRLRGQAVDLLHAHFADRAATVALVAGRLLKIPYSLALHAGEDIFVHPVLLPEKLSEAKFVISCTQYNLDYLSGQGMTVLAEKGRCIHHGLDIEHYPPASQPQQPPLLMSVGRLVEKKGLDYLIRACGMLRDQGYDFRCEIIGPGPEQDNLQAWIDKLGLQQMVKLCGGMPHEQVIASYERASIFVLPCVEGRDGALDGIPNVLPEAMAMELPVVSTNVSAIPELVQDGVNGLLVPSRDERALVAALARLLDDPALRKQLGRAGRLAVIEKFDIDRNVRAVYDVFQLQGAQ